MLVIGLAHFYYFHFNDYVDLILSSSHPVDILNHIMFRITTLVLIITPFLLIIPLIYFSICYISIKAFKSKRSLTYECYLKSNSIQIDKRECPICLQEIQLSQQVIGLPCSKLHIYHKECFSTMLSQGTEKCALCRIEF